jgi:hypothetical protein
MLRVALHPIHTLLDLQFTRDYSSAVSPPKHTRTLLRAEHEVSMSNIRVPDLARQLDMDIVYHMSC